ncbi:MAG TPA: hypothetical protein VHY35_23135 [Stellaceae bacterium]|jgi:hypothetical protein|nr:hypothetical protein [Stellaceae bacterium]
MMMVFSRLKILSAISAVLLAVLLVSARPLAAGDISVSPDFGMNFNFESLDKNKISECSPRNRSAPSRGHGFLRRYDNQKIRSTVLRELADMRHAGFQEIRTLVFFGKTIEAGANVFPVETPEIAAHDVSTFAKDVRNAGFSRLYLAFGPQGIVTPGCRRQQWGDCFDPLSIDLSTKFIARVRAALDPASAAILQVDLQNEGGLTHYHPEQMRRNMDSYLHKVIGTYLSQFPNDQTTVSIQQKQPEERLKYVLAAYENARRSPAFFDFHVYDVQPDLLNMVKIALQSTPERIPVVIGEFPYGDAEMLRKLQNALTAGRQSYGIPVYFWPLRNVSGACGVDTPPPYDLKWLH